MTVAGALHACSKVPLAVLRVEAGELPTPPHAWIPACAGMTEVKGEVGFAGKMVRGAHGGFTPIGGAQW